MSTSTEAHCKLTNGNKFNVYGHSGLYEAKVLLTAGPHNCQQFSNAPPGHAGVGVVVHIDWEFAPLKAEQ